jgi:hypothetical protein
VTIDSLPDFVLLEIFGCRVGLAIEVWVVLVYVCRKWRDIVFESPRRLNLQLLCAKTKRA